MNRRKFLKMTGKTALDIARGKLPSFFAVGELVGYRNRKTGKLEMIGRVSNVFQRQSQYFDFKNRIFHYYEIKSIWTSDAHPDIGRWVIGEGHVELLK
jgi:hypothetical protein